MRTSFFLLALLLCLSYAPHHSSSSSSSSRRILHQPFFPQDSLPPSQTPSPSPPSPAKLPFTTSTPVDSPFFPSFPSPPPPPPSPASFASFPANISSLILPQSPRPKAASQKLVAATIAAVVSAFIVLGIFIFYFIRRSRNRRRFTDDKSYRSDNANGSSNAALYAANVTAVTSNRHKLRANSTSSEFLYLGTLVNSRSINETSYDNVGSNPRKLDSPELRPLPPLNRQSSVQNRQVGSTTEDDDDDGEQFYSPRGSLGGRESSSGTGSGSRRMLAAVGSGGYVGDFDAKNSDDSSCYSSSTSGSASPVRSQSVSISPPVSQSPRRKSPESSAVVQAPPPPPPPPQPPQQPTIVVETSSSSSRSSSACSSPNVSPSILLNLERRVQLDSLSSASNKSSQRVLNDLGRNVRSPPLSPARILNDLDHSRVTPSLSSVSASVAASPTSAVNDLDQNVRSLQLSSASSSPGRVSEKLPSSKISFDLDGNRNGDVRSPSLSSVSVSLERGLENNPFDENIRSPLSSSASSTPGRCLGLMKSLDASPRMIPGVLGLNEKISSVLEQPITAPPPPPPPPTLPPPPPPPPPPSLATQRLWESPSTSTPTGQPISKPPMLIPPSRPFVLQSTSKVSPIELPPSSTTLDDAEDTSKPKLKPLHWDKVRASSDREMVWDHLRSSSFKLNEEMIETLFIVNTPTQKQTTLRPVVPSPNQENRVLDPKKAQNIAILLRALNVTIEEVCEALLEGSADTLGTELLESLLKMAPSKEEERKLKEYKDDSQIKLCHAEKFLKAVLDIPFAFKRVDAMLYIANFESEVEYLKKSFETLETACEELRNSRMFLKLLEAVLKTGNRMNVGTNRGDAHAFKLDTLLKLVDVKGADGKTTLLHFVVQEIIRTEGARLSGTNQTPNSISSDDAKCRKLGLQVVSGISSELSNVKKSAAMDSDVLSGEVSKLSRGIENITDVVRLNETMGLDESNRKFSESMNRFMTMAEEEIIRIQALESVALSLVKEITEYFHGNSAKEEAHPFRIFMVVRDFLSVLDRVCKEVGMINERTIVSSAHKFPIPVNPTLPVPVNPKLLPGTSGSNLRRQYSSSDDESPSP